MGIAGNMSLYTDYYKLREHVRLSDRLAKSWKTLSSGPSAVLALGAYGHHSSVRWLPAP
jgi:hypothetical protein